MKIIEVVELNEKGVKVDEVNKGTVGEIRYFEDNNGICSGNYCIDDISGIWVHLEGEHTNFSKYAYRSIDDTTLVPESIFKNHLINEMEDSYADYNEMEGSE